MQQGDWELPTGVTAVEQSQGNGRAEQRVRALRERLQIMIEDARRCGVEIILGSSSCTVGSET